MTGTQQDLSLGQETFRLVRIRADDVRFRSDDLFLFRELILRNENSYPGIAKWLDNKVLTGLKNGERTGFLGLLNEKPVAAAVIKKGEAAKFCHLKIEPEARNLHLGDLFFSLMTLEVRHKTKNVRFTLPESVWSEKKEFFTSFSFTSAQPSQRQYRLFDPELFAQASFPSLFDITRHKIANVFGQLKIGDHSLLTGAVLAVHPAPLEKIFSRMKSVEVRTKFSRKWESKRVSLYATQPVSALVGEARIGRVLTGSPDYLWELLGHKMGCTRMEYEAYTKGHETVFAITLEDVKQYSDSIPLAQLSHLLGIHLAAPQSYLSLANSDSWLSAVALSAALQGSISIRKFNENARTTDLPVKSALRA